MANADMGNGLHLELVLTEQMLCTLSTVYEDSGFANV